MNRLKYNRAYLCGPMEMSEDNGQDWRINIQRELKDLNIIWLDPTQKPTRIALENEETKHILNELREKEDYDLLKQMGIPIRGYDLRMVDVCDFLVVHLNKDVPTCGTWEELFWGNRQKKPILVHYEQGRESIPHWLYFSLPKQTMFGSWEEVYTYIRHINSDPNIDDLGRWRFFDFSLCRNFD